MNLFAKAGSSKHSHGHRSGSSRNHGHKHHSEPKASTSNLGSTSVAVSVDGVRRPEEPSFLFVVNEFSVNYEPPVQGMPALTDQWANPMPPTDAGAYGDEQVGHVFRYRSGVITPAVGYQWYRPALNDEGCIVRVDQAGNITGYPVFHNAQSIFTCSSHLPVIVGEGDASLGQSFMRRLCRCDAISENTPGFAWCILHFTENELLPGVSLVTANGHGRPNVVGSAPSWVPFLVPGVYQNTRATTESAGLAGRVAILIGLMALHSRPGRASDVFNNGKWQGHEWRDPGPFRAPRPDENPRGLLVYVCYDNLINGQDDSEENNISTEACRQMMETLEWCSVLVRG
ncbi:hypothetical protein QBC35DRAFT_516632 [Podospora australis]|uniref:Uncharacterized protein n=1 Tax=Podospora australis TaxID=1536484 RepID=A0AAN7AG23_9PEZI|nr:hypothetical protein QBC35DRAFT_516632 [Podospora australis]